MRAFRCGPLGVALWVGLAVGARAEPVRVPLDDVVDLSVGDTHACAVTGDGLVHCWGDGRDYRLGNGRELSSRVPVQVPGLRGVARVAAGGHVTCALRIEGEVLCWGGLAPGGRGGEDDLEPVEAPRVVATALHGTVDLSVGRHQIVLVDRAGDVSILSNYTGPIPLPGFRSIRAVESFSEGFCGVASDGQIHCVTSNESVVWDGGAAGGYGEEPSTVLRAFSEVPVQAREVYTEACESEEARPSWCRETARLASAAGPRGFDVHGALACMIADSGSGSSGLACFGCADCYGSEPPPLGLRAEPVAVPVVIAAAKDLPPITEVAVGERHVCVLADQVYCWGDGAEGQLGSRPLSFVVGRPSWDGAAFPVLEPRLGSATPLVVEGLGDVVKLEAGDTTTCALRRDRTVLCWGRELGTPPAYSLRDLERPDAMPGVERPQSSFAGWASPLCEFHSRAAWLRQAFCELEPLEAPVPPPGEVCRELDVFARGELEERRYGYDSKGRLVREELRLGPLSVLDFEERHRLSRDGHVLQTDRLEWFGDRWHRSATRFRRDRAGRVIWQKARGSTNDDVQVFRYDRQGRLVETREGVHRTTVRHVVWPVSGGDPTGVPLPDTLPADAHITEALSESPWDQARHLEVFVGETLVHERQVEEGRVVATTYEVGADGVEVVRESHYAWAFHERPLRRVETRTTPARGPDAPAVVERWEAVGPGPLVLTRRTIRLETGCLE